MTTYKCDEVRGGYEADGMASSEAARHFLGVLARREFGRRGICATVRHDCSAANGAYAIYEGFCGTSNREGNVTGRNLRVTIRRASVASAEVV